MSRPKLQPYAELVLSTKDNDQHKIGSLMNASIIGDYMAAENERHIIVKRQLPVPKPRETRKANSKPKASGKALDPKQDFAQPLISGGE